MKKIIILTFLIIISLPAYSKTKAEEEKKEISVFTSILPQKYFIERIGGNRVNCEVLVGPGKSPATYQPKPSQIVKLGEADILFTIGVPFEKGFIHKIEDSLNGLKIVDTSMGITKRSIEAHEHHEDEHHEDEHHEDEHHEDEHHEDEHHEDEHHDDDGNDPHVWLSPLLSIKVSENILNTLIEEDPEGEEYYRSRFNELADDLKAIDNELRTILEPYKGKILLVYHPSFGYFTDEYGLIQEAIETGGKEPTPLQLDEIVVEAKEEGIKVIAVQPEFSKKSAQVIADHIGGTMIVLNPLSEDYINNLKNIAEVIISAYK